MVVAENDICQVTQDVWASVLGLCVRSLPTRAPAFGDENSLTGCVQITGAFEGAVTLESSTELARRAAGIVLGVDPVTTSLEEIRDVLGELTNIIGGNLKGLVPGPSHLSLPAVVDGVEFRLTVPRSRLVTEATFDCEGEPLRVTILRGIENDKDDE